MLKYNNKIIYQALISSRPIHCIPSFPNGSFVIRFTANDSKHPEIPNRSYHIMYTYAVDLCIFMNYLFCFSVNFTPICPPNQLDSYSILDFTDSLYMPRNDKPHICLSLIPLITYMAPYILGYTRSWTRTQI